MGKTVIRNVALLCVLVLAGCNEQKGSTGENPQAAQAAAVQVGVVVLAPQSVPRAIELPGRVVALATAEIRPEVDGIVRKIVFTQGRGIAEGDVLYELDPRKFNAALGSAQAALTKAQLIADAAQSSFDRNKRLAAANAVSAQTAEDARMTLLQAQADVEAASANVETAKINLDNATIKAPISGMIGKSAVSVGALVTQNQTDALATIRQVDPIYVDLVDSSANLLRIRDQVQAGTLGRPDAGMPKVTLVLENGEPYGVEGTISLADMVVSQSTGTFSVRASFANPDRILLPGMFVQASVSLGNTPDAFLVPQRAVTRNIAGEATAYFVSDDGKAETRVLKTSASIGNDWLVTGGIKDGDKLIVDGLQKISNGSGVTPVEVTIDADGVIKQVIAPGQDAAKQVPAK